MRRLRKAYLEITNVCNLACDFCPGTRRAPGFLSPEGFRILAASLRPHTDYLYLHLMGEPLLHPQLELLLEEAAALGFRGMQFNAVVAGNTAALRIYRGLGFQTVGTIPGGFLLPDGTYSDMYVMYRPLGSA